MKRVHHRDAPFTPLFVGGAPRSGTTVLHALICTSAKVNPYLAESSYFTALFRAYQVANDVFAVHTKDYFPDPAALADYHSDLLQRVLFDFWTELGTPAILALKDPMATPHFDQLAQLLPNAKFAVVIRDPRDAISSRIEAYRRGEAQRGRSGQVTREVLKALCREYNLAYLPLVRSVDAFSGRLLVVRYEELVVGNGNDAVAAFLGVDDLVPERVWQDARSNPAAQTEDPTHSDLYGRPLTSAAVGRHRDRLDDETAARILSTCGMVARALGVAF